MNKMSWWYCVKHQKISTGSNISDNKISEPIIELMCGCKLNKEDKQKYRITKKISYYLADGTPLKKIEKEAHWVMEAKK